MDKFFFGIIMVLIGLYMLISGTKKSEFVVYKILVAKTEKLWGKNVHKFYQIVGLIIIIFGILMTTGVS